MVNLTHTVGRTSREGGDAIQSHGGKVNTVCQRIPVQFYTGRILRTFGQPVRMKKDKTIFLLYWFEFTIYIILFLENST